MRRALLAAAAALLLAPGLPGCGGGGDATPAPAAPLTLQVASPAFAGGAAIPARFACDGEDRSPPLSWSGVPAEARAVAVIVEDPDARGFIHWALFDLPGADGALLGGASPGGELPAGAREGKNDFGRAGYGGPCPPRGSTHRYLFRVLALDAPLGLAAGVRGKEVRKAAAAHAIAEGRLEGTYRRP